MDDSSIISDPSFQQKQQTTFYLHYILQMLSIAKHYSKDVLCIYVKQKIYFSFTQVFNVHISVSFNWELFNDSKCYQTRLAGYSVQTES